MHRLARPTAGQLLEEEVWQWLAEVPDPEIPVISIVDLGIIRRVRWDERRSPARLVVTVTPTYSGCPATEVIAASIRDAIGRHGIDDPIIETRLSPPWTTDWLSAVGKEKLKQYGIAPPVGKASEHVIDISRIQKRGLTPTRVPCPRCGSVQTELTSQFGSTPCKALYQCTACKEPFDYFKCH